MARFRKIYVSVIVVVLAFALPALSQRSRTRAAGSPGSFDYYVLSLSWAPEFCAQPGEAATNPGECTTGRHLEFVVHGLWPEANAGKSPESCGPATKVSKGLVNQLLQIMPSPGLIQHEWATHGTCTGLSQDDYFTKVMLARAAVQVPVQMAEIGTTATESPTQIEKQFAGSNPAFPDGAIHTACRGNAFTEVRVCFDKSLEARACSASAGECTSPTVTIRPPR
jgi:ribonuclease T2